MGTSGCLWRGRGDRRLGDKGDDEEIVRSCAVDAIQNFAAEFGQAARSYGRFNKFCEFYRKFDGFDPTKF
jgi:hypothetical protein